MKKSKKDLEFVRFVEDLVKTHGMKTPIKLRIGFHKLARRNDPDGNQCRYFKTYIGDCDVTAMVADFIECTLSKAKDTYDCLMMHGCGMDMAFYIQYLVHLQASSLGKQDLFSMSYYEYLGKWHRGRYTMG